MRAFIAANSSATSANAGDDIARAAATHVAMAVFSWFFPSSLCNSSKLYCNILLTYMCIAEAAKNNEPRLRLRSPRLKFLTCGYPKQSVQGY